MAEITIDAKLDSGAHILQYFKTMLNIAAVLTPGIDWPDWTDYFCRHYDRERGTDLAAIRGDAAMLRAEASTAKQTVTDQTAIKGDVQRAWPDSAGNAAVTTIDAYLRVAAPVALALEATAKAAEGVADVITSAVDKKVQRMTAEFDQSTSLYVEHGGAWNMLVDGPTGLVDKFVEQFNSDIRQFNSIVSEATSSIEAANAKVPAAAAAVDSIATFPTPTFGTIGGTTSPGTTSPGTTSPGTTSPGSTSPGSASPGGGSTSPGGSTSGKTGTTTGTTPTSTTPTTGAITTGTSPAATTPTSATPTSANPLSGQGGTSGTDGVPSWLSQLIPKIAEQLGLGKGDDKADAKDGTGKDEKDKDATKAETKDAQGRTVTATLSPDGKTVEVTVKKPDGTEQKATLRVGEDGKLTLDEAKDKPAGTTPAGTAPAATAPAGATPSEGAAKGDGSAAAAGAATTPGTSTNGTSPGAATPGAVPSTPAATTDSPATPTAPAPAAPKSTASQPESAATEPCPPEQQGTGAELAVTVP